MAVLSAWRTLVKTVANGHFPPFLQEVFSTETESGRPKHTAAEALQPTSGVMEPLSQATTRALAYQEPYCIQDYTLPVKTSGKEFELI